MEAELGRDLRDAEVASVLLEQGLGTYILLPTSGYVEGLPGRHSRSERGLRAREASHGNPAVECSLGARSSCRLASLRELCEAPASPTRQQHG
jgi:hypothetical protein